MDSQPPDFSVPPTFIEHTVFTRDLTGWPTCWSFDRQVPFQQNKKAKMDNPNDQDRTFFGGMADSRREDELNIALDRKKSYAYISHQSRNPSYRLAPMAYRYDDFPSYRVYFSVNLVNFKNDSYPASLYLDSDHVLLGYLPSDDKYNYPKVSKSVPKTLKNDRETIEKKIIPKGEKILAIQKSMFFSLEGWETRHQKFPVYYDRKYDDGVFFERIDLLRLDTLKHPIVFDMTSPNSMWVLTKSYLYLLPNFATKEGFALETRTGDIIRYENIDLKDMDPSDGWLLRWERAPEEKCREAFAPLVTSTVTPEEAKPIFIDKPKAP